MVYIMLLTVTVQAVCTYCRNYYYDCIVCHLNRLRMHNAYNIYIAYFNLKDKKACDTKVSARQLCVYEGA